MEVEAAGSSVDGGVLGNVGVVDHTVLAVLHKGMDFRVAVGGKPLMQECETGTLLTIWVSGRN